MMDADAYLFIKTVFITGLEKFRIILLGKKPWRPTVMIMMVREV